MLAIALLYAQAAASPPAPPVELWRGLGTATTRAEIRAFGARLTGNRVEILPGCNAEFLHRFVKGSLASIVLLGNNRDAPCTQLLLDDLTRQYGPPRSSNETQATGPFVGGGMAFTGSITRRDHVWQAQGRRVVLAMMPGNGYNLIFTVRPEKYLY